MLPYSWIETDVYGENNKKQTQMVYHMYNFLIYPSLCDTIIPASRLYSSPFHRFCQFLQGHFSGLCYKLPGQHKKITQSLIAPSLSIFPLVCLFTYFFLSNWEYSEQTVSVNFFMGIVMWFSLGIKAPKPNPTKLMPFPIQYLQWQDPVF